MKWQISEQIFPDAYIPVCSEIQFCYKFSNWTQTFQQTWQLLPSLLLFDACLLFFDVPKQSSSFCNRNFLSEFIWIRACRNTDFSCVDKDFVILGYFKIYLYEKFSKASLWNATSLWALDGNFMLVMDESCFNGWMWTVSTGDGMTLHCIKSDIPLFCLLQIFKTGPNFEQYCGSSVESN